MCGNFNYIFNIDASTDTMYGQRQDNEMGFGVTDFPVKIINAVCVYR